jgi:C-1 hydroxylase
VGDAHGQAVTRRDFARRVPAEDPPLGLMARPAMSLSNIVPFQSKEISMSPDENKTIARRYLEETHSKGNLDIIDELCTPAFGAGQKAILGMELKAFPDMQWTIEDMVAEGDKVVLRLTSQGTHLGEFHDWHGFGVLPPTGKAWTCSSIFIYRLADGRIAEGWGVNDILSVYLQLGVVPLPR